MAEQNTTPHSGTTALFQNPILEKLTRTHVLVPIGILTSFALFLLVWGGLYSSLAWYGMIILFIAGWLSFSLVEYLMHRYVFHMATDTKTKANIQYKFHGVHHDYPKDKDRLAMPPLLSAAISTLLFFIFRFLMGDAVFAFLPGFLIGYTAYLGVHYIVHAWQPPKNIFKHLWIHHGIHHYKDHERAYGVSSPLWDFIFRTMPRKLKR